MQILAAFRSGLNTFEIARKFSMKEPDVVRYLHQEMDRVRSLNSADRLPRPTPPGPSPGALPSAFGPGGNPTREPTA